jgi:hypothetical protein
VSNLEDIPLLESGLADKSQQSGLLMGLEWCWLFYNPNSCPPFPAPEASPEQRLRRSGTASRRTTPTASGVARRLTTSRHTCFYQAPTTAWVGL